MEALKMIPYIILTICVSGIIAGACAVVLAQFKATTTNDVDFNHTINNASAANLTIAEQLPTVAIIGVLVIIISLLAGVFVYMKYFG